MSHIMLWVACYREINDRHAYLLFLDKMLELFIELVKDPQVKI